MLDRLGWEGNYNDVIRNDCQPNVCRIFQDPAKNCQIGYCWPDAGTDCIATPVSALATNFGIIEEWCGRGQGGAGGYHGNLEVGKNDRFDPGPGSRRVLDSGVVEASYSREDYELLMANSTSRVGKRQAQDSSVEKRQDGEWHTQLSGVVVRTAGRIRASSILSSGVEQTWTHSSTVTTGTTVSAGMGIDLFGVFSASVGVESTMEHSETVENSMTYTVGDCPSGEGYVYWEPIVDWWSGYFIGDQDTKYDIWIPRELNGYADGSVWSSRSGRQ